MSTNRFAATTEQNAEDQLKALYGCAPIRTGKTSDHRMTWHVKKRRATMASKSSHVNGRGEPMFIVEVK
ncbi:hypothetical protein ACXHQB_23835 [Vibrio parahaemolyticus]|uniref:hypothetical protein n=1 Tax=Vibrio parahaemolyticus TaxID=670 RepID=UPI001A20DA2D|nr:hypothetical protein [Vibrio parahaemolyticus]MCC3798237.1 hypothetical protein [Vibrio parahaemolyticus]HAS6073696.1 hypothetical protein [Vibrio vulnificus]